MSLKVAFFSSKGLIVTGYKGFIGRAICDQLKSEGEECEVIDLYEITDARAIVQLASKVEDSSAAYTNNINLDLMVFDYCVDNNVHVIYSSTNNVYSYARKCNVESDRVISDYYSASKIHAENMLSELYTVESTVLRFGDVFGVGQRHGNFFRSIENAVSTSSELSLYGKGLKVRNYIYIKDIVNLVMNIISPQNLSKHVHRTYNVAYCEPININQIVSYVADKTKLDITTVEMPVEKEIEDFRTLLCDEIDGFAYEFDIWSSLDDYLASISLNMR